jgi:hypothetical protein
LGESILTEWARERKTKTKSYGSQGALQALTVGFRMAAAANPGSSRPRGPRYGMSCVSAWAAGLGRHPTPAAGRVRLGDATDRLGYRVRGPHDEQTRALAPEAITQGVGPATGDVRPGPPVGRDLLRPECRADCALGPRSLWYPLRAPLAPQADASDRVRSPSQLKAISIASALRSTQCYPKCSGPGVAPSGDLSPEHSR